MISPNHYTIVILIMCALFSAVDAQAQKKEPIEVMNKIEQNTVSGTILGEDDEPLVGATIMVKGTTNGTVADIDGNFSLLLDKPKATLVISYVGYNQTEMPIDLSHDSKHGVYIRVVLKASTNMMQEVVVTGYQNIKRESATGSYQTIKAEDMDKRYTGDLTSNLEGKVPGLVYDPKKTEENAIIIRGQGTFNAKTSPLVVLDGLPIEGGMNSVNPYDIDNITILKDAAAAAIYGARASNGVIVITTKRAKGQNLTIDFNADIVMSENQDYSNHNWANSEEILRLEQYNFDAMLRENPKQIKDNLKYLNSNRQTTLSQAMRVLLQEYSGTISTDEKNLIFDRWKRNDYRKEWQEAHDRNEVRQQYNLSMRVNGRMLASSLTVNFSNGNRGAANENDNSLSFKYRGDLHPAKWVDLSFGVNVLNNRSKYRSANSYDDINSFMNYESMKDENGELSKMEADIYLQEKALSNPLYNLKEVGYNFLEEQRYNFSNYRYTNIRSYIDALFHLPVEGWTAQAQFQYEDIFSRTRSQINKESQFFRSLYDRYTTAETVKVWVDDPDFNLFEEMNKPDFDWDGYLTDPNFGKIQVSNTEVAHNIPDGDILSTTTIESQYYTFRAQTAYTRQFAEKHDIDLLAGFEFRETHSKMDSNLLYGYNHDTQSNLNLLTNWSFINNPQTGVMGSNYALGDAPKSFNTSDVLHRFYSYYFTANYVYDTRYSVSGSFRVDKTDLFGTDPKFRGRPLWSVGASWNAHNESFMRSLIWLDVLKVRGSYGLTGNIDSSVSSYLTATLSNNYLNGNQIGHLQTPPNDQLRWEKTATWNAGVDFGLFGYRIAGSLDVYHKSGSDILTDTDLDPTTGWTSLRINSGKMINTGVELALNGVILQQKSRKDFGLSLGFNVAYNKNKVTSVSHKAASGSEYLSMSLHEGYPINSLFAIDYAGLVDIDGTRFVGWKDKEGNMHTESIGSAEFTIGDCKYMGSYTPTWTGAIDPELRWNGFSISAMINFYAGHYMRTGNEVWNNSMGDAGGYCPSFGMGAVSKDLLEYWEGNSESVPANGYMQIHNGSNISAGTYRHTNIEKADYMKLRNVVLSYNFDRKLTKKIGINELRLRFQINNVCTWARNKQGIDPEAYNLIGGYHLDKTPRSYTMSLFINI